MLQAAFKSSRTAVIGAFAIGLALTISSFTIVRAEHEARPDNSCKSSNPCAIFKNTGTGIGIEGQAIHQSAVYGASSEPGVYAQTNDTTGTYFGLVAVSKTNSGGPLYASSPNGSMYVDPSGNMHISGQIYTGGSCKNGCSRSRGLASFGGRTSQPTLDDVGEGALRNGFARVTLAPDFANAIDSSKPYVVLLTPEGDAGLYVTNRSAAGFEVRQIGGGRSSVEFAYRIVAKPYGVRDERLPFKAAPNEYKPNVR